MSNDLESSQYRAVAWLIMGIGLCFVLWKQLLIALFAGLLVHEVVFMLEPLLLRMIKLERDIAKMALVAFIASIVITVLIILVVSVVKFFQAGAENLPALLNKMAEILESSRNSLPLFIRDNLPADVPQLQNALAQWLREHAEEVRLISKEAGRAVALTIIGMIIGALVALRQTKHTIALLPFQQALAERVAKLAASFRNVVFAQLRIASINAIFTGIYLAIILPLVGVSLPFTKTIIALTFLFGLIPVVGNLVSNTAIVIVSMSHSLLVAASSLAFLIVIHKAEYFLNARIIGARIRANAWELLIAMVTLESLFGLAGVVAAPIYYAYLKTELSSAKLIPA